MSKIPFTDTMRFDPDDTLFVTDLDGTLLTADAVLPEGAVERIWELHNRGVHLTYATARTIRSAAFILAGLPFSEPVSLMNGVLMRDMNTGRYVEGNLLPAEAVELILRAGGEPFVYTLSEDDQLFTAYRQLGNVYMEDFLRERVDKYGKPFRQMEDFRKLLEEKQRIIYCCYLDTDENLRPIYNTLSALQDADGEPLVRCEYYHDHYRPGLWYMEVFSKQASKGNVCKKLREMTGRKVIVSFGDNNNDLPLFAESDYAFAVERANDTVKRAADAVIPGEIGVLEFIKNHVKQE